MNAEALTLPDLTERERADLRDLDARREVLARSDFNRRAHALIEHARIIRERLETFLCDFGRNEALKVLTAAFPEEKDRAKAACRYGTDTFVESHEQIEYLAEKLDDFLMLTPCDLPPLPAEQEVPHVS